MGICRAFVCCVFPPLGVIDKGCGSIVIVTALMFFGWIPAVIAAAVINLMSVKKVEGK